MSSQAPVDTADIVRVVAAEYDVGMPDECRLMHFGLNDTYAIEVAGRRYALRLYGQNKGWIAGESDLRFELGLLQHLYAEGVPVSYPIARRNGDPLGRLVTPNGQRHYALFSWATGQPGAETEAQSWQVGHALAAIHVAADRYESEHSRWYVLDGPHLLSFLQQQEPSLEQAEPEVARFIRDRAAHIRNRLRNFDAGPTGWGIIHGDLQWLNIHFTEDGQITIFDFDGCGYGWRAFDIAYYITRIPAHLRTPVLEGYETVRPLSDAEHNMIPTLGQAAWIKEGSPVTELVKLLTDPYI